MLKWAVIFLIVAIVSALLGFTTLAGLAAHVAQFLFFAFLAVCVLFVALALFAGRRA